MTPVTVSATARRQTPWSVHWLGAAPVAPAWAAAGAAALLVAVFLAQELALGRFAQLARLADPYRDVRLAIVNILLLVYGPTAYAYVVRGARRTVRELRPVLAMDEAEQAALAAEVGAYPAAGLRVAGLLGLAVGLATPFFVDSAREVPPYDPAFWTPEVIWHRVSAPIVGWFVGRFFLAMLEEGGRLTRLAERLAPLDVFDLGGLAPFTRQGLTHALLTIGFVSLFALALFEWGFARLFAGVATAALAAALGGLLLAVEGVRRRIRAARRAELAACQARLRSLRAAGIPPADEQQLAELVDLLEYRRALEAVREWPFDVSTLARVALYALLPLGSWLGAALVERVLDVVLG